MCNKGLRFRIIISALAICFVFSAAVHAQSLKWPAPPYLGGNVHSSPAVGTDGYIYVGSHNGWLYKISPATGSAQQLYYIGGNVFSTPAIGLDGTIYIGALSGRLYAIDPGGVLKWVYPLSGAVYSSPAIGRDGTIFVGTNGGRLYAISPDGSPKWPQQSVSVGPVFTAPAVNADGIVHVATTNGYLYAVNGTDGSFAWSQPFHAGVAFYSSPAIDADGTIYLVGLNNGYLYAVNPDGSQKWLYAIPGGSGDYYYVQSSPAIGADGTIYVGSYSSGRLNAITPAGSMKWFYSLGTTCSSPAVGDDGTIYIGTMSGYLFGISDHGTSGSPAAGWPYSMGGNAVASPAIDIDGTVYIGTYSGRLYAFNSSSAGPAHSVWPMFSNNAARTGAVALPECDPGFYGPDCLECPGGAAAPCSGHGICDEGLEGSGACLCDPGFVGAACDACEPGYYGPACDSVCPGGAANPCSGFGTCDDGVDGDGGCSCDAGFTGDACDAQSSDCKGACAHTRSVCVAACYVENNDLDYCQNECRPPYDACLAECPLLWNRMGSTDQLQNSIYGPGLLIDGATGFTDGVSGNGFYSKGGWYCDNRILTPDNALQLDPQRGTIEAWVRYPLDPIVQPYNYSMFSIIDGPYQKGSGRDPLIGDQVLNYIGDGVTGTLFTMYVGVNFGSQVTVTVPGVDAIFGDHLFHHVAIVWDRDGIDGSSNTVRLLIDSQIAGSSDDGNWGTTPDVGTHHSIGKGENIPSNSDPAIAAFVLDEVKVWDYARTDFDMDNDGIPNGSDNCPDTPNGPMMGTCTAGDNAGGNCASNAACGTGGVCSMGQEDTDGDGAGDACFDSIAMDNETLVDSFDVAGEPVEVVECDFTVTENGSPVSDAQISLDIDVDNQSITDTLHWNYHGRFKIVSPPTGPMGKTKMRLFKNGSKLRDANSRYRFRCDERNVKKWFPQPAVGCCEINLTQSGVESCFETVEYFCRLKDRLLRYLDKGDTSWTAGHSCSKDTDRCEGPVLIRLAAFRAEPRNGSVVLRWTTASEFNNAGFHLYRSASVNGEFVRINQALIPARKGAAGGASYEYVDNNLENRHMYYYRLEDIDVDGTATRHEPVSATPRLIYGR